MGMYVNSTSNGNCGSSASSKCEAILADGGVEISEPTEFVENLVCVVNNGPFGPFGSFGAAAYAHNEREFNLFKKPDGRPKRWFIWDKVTKFAM